MSTQSALRKLQPLIKFFGGLNDIEFILNAARQAENEAALIASSIKKNKGEADKVETILTKIREKLDKEEANYSKKMVDMASKHKKRDSDLKNKYINDREELKNAIDADKDSFEKTKEQQTKVISSLDSDIKNATAMLVEITKDYNQIKSRFSE